MSTITKIKQVVSDEELTIFLSEFYSSLDSKPSGLILNDLEEVIRSIVNDMYVRELLCDKSPIENCD